VNLITYHILTCTTSYQPYLEIDSAIMGELARIRLLSPEDISTSSPPLGMVLSAINVASGLDMHTVSSYLQTHNI
jgi:hypothetical protein